MVSPLRLFVTIVIGTQLTDKLWEKRLREEPQNNIVESVHRELDRFFRTLLADQHTK